MKGAFLAALIVSAVLVGSEAAADYSVEGDHGSLVVTASKAARSEVLAAILEGFGIESNGEAIVRGEVSGRFEGDLGHILKQVAPGMSFVLSRRDGRPVKVIFAEKGSLPAEGALSRPDDEPEPPVMTGVPGAQEGPDGGDEAPSAPMPIEEPLAAPEESRAPAPRPD